MLFAFASCKDDKKSLDVEKNTAVLENNDDYFSLSINAIVENDDKFILFYLEEERDITKENSVSVNVIGSTEPQLLVFKLHEDVLPRKLVLRFGNEEMKQKIKFQDSRIDYHDKEIVMDSAKFYQFFIPNEFIDYNQEESTASTKINNGNYNPTFFSRKVLEDKINYTLF